MQKPLHTLERRLLKTLSTKKEGVLEEVAEEAGLNLDQARRAVEWLKSKDMLRTDIKLTLTTGIRLLDTAGIKAVKEGLPERRLVRHLSEMGGEAPLEELKNRFRTTPQEFSAALGNARRRSWIIVHMVNGKPVAELGRVEKTTPEEDLLKKLSEGKVKPESLTSEEKSTLSSLAKRPQYIKEKKSKTVRIRLTPLGVKTARTLSEGEELDALTPELLVTGGWRGRTLRPIDVEAPSPPIYPGKKHPVQRFIDEVREIFVALGFEEIDGPIIQPCFWNFDALFIPQDHPAREMQDTFYLSGVKVDRIDDEEALRNVSKVHEDGGGTGSTGWGYKWSLAKSKDTVLRTHTTAVTVKYLADFKPEEARVFSVGRVFRNEKVTFKNIVEFHQIEGIAVGEKVTLRDLMGLLSKFYSKLGLKKMKFWPTFFPYTEPSLQSVVYFEELNKWVELCGMGIFRPEVTLPLGVKNPVLAWGGGLERLVMLRHGITDIRDLYGNSLEWLRRIPLCR
ncbi:MAG: phenylalanine--tRNA ligase subunit alpha [Nitrososphaerales archaeon]